MDAFRLLDWGSVGYAAVPVPEPGPGEVLLRVGGAGLCGSDLHFMHLEPGGWASPPPWTLGHENAGWVEERGPGAGRFAEGDPVLATGIHSCGHCRACLRGQDNLCGDVMGGRGAGSDGGLSRYLVVPERELVPLGGLDPRIAAPLADAGHTSYAAVQSARSKLTPDASALVIGVGGLGIYAIQYLKLITSAQIIAADINDERRQLAGELGADHTISSDGSLQEAVDDLTLGQGVDVIFDFVANQATVDTAMACSAAGGSVVLLGMSDEVTVRLAFAQSPPAGCQIYWNLGGSLRELAEVVALAERGHLRIDVEQIPFDQIPRALGRLERGELRGRAVVLPNG